LSGKQAARSDSLFLFLSLFLSLFLFLFLVFLFLFLVFLFLVILPAVFFLCFCSPPVVPWSSSAL